MCTSKGYYVENIQPELFEKGKNADDMVLMEKMWDVETRLPIVSHFILVVGDKDHSIAVDRLLRNGKTVHVISREESRARKYEYLARAFPARFSTHTLEELLERQAVGS